jgi:hypothetical protein
LPQAKLRNRILRLPLPHDSLFLGTSLRGTLRIWGFDRAKTRGR